jgi:hypothetical protein
MINKANPWLGHNYKRHTLLFSCFLFVGLSACTKQDEDQAKSTAQATARISEITFTETPAPTTVAEMGSTYTQSKAILKYDDGSTKEYPLSYQKLFGVKDKVGASNYPAGQLFSQDGTPILDPFDKPLIAETPDGNSLLKVSNKLYLVTHYEYDWILSDGSVVKKYAKQHDDWWRRMPMSMTLTTLEQDDKGLLKAVAQEPIDFSDVGGLYIPCFASQTPWNTHLGSEENYDIDAYKVENGTDTALEGMNNLYFKSANAANPYHYGIIPEVTVKADGKTETVKHFAMGRATWEMGKVMPDRRTVYLGSDGSNQPLIMFVADQEDDLSAGTLYAAKWTNQTRATDGGAASLSWIKLGEGSDADIKALADKTQFSNIFKRVESETAGYKRIRANSKKDEYLQLKDNMETAAAFLETARYAAYKGATTEFNKMEGVAVNAQDKKVYIAMSYIKGGMNADREAPADHIKVDKINAGAVYELSVTDGQKDSDGIAINSDYVATTMQGLVIGKDIETDQYGNKAAVDYIANPDNVFYSEKLRTLFIGEDSGLHVNNFLWAYNVDTQQLTRILSLVAGAESTGLQVAENINGFSYIMSNAQHQGDFIKSMDEELKKELATKIDRFDAPVGYIAGLPSLSDANE